MSDVKCDLLEDVMLGFGKIFMGIMSLTKCWVIYCILGPYYVVLSAYYNRNRGRHLPKMRNDTMVVCYLVNFTDLLTNALNYNQDLRKYLIDIVNLPTSVGSICH